MSGYLTAAQIISQACNIAKCPGYATPVGSSIAGLMFNEMLEELYNDYDFEINRKVFNFNFNSAVGTGLGPYSMPANYLRAMKDGVFYTIFNVPYKVIAITLQEFDSFNKDPGLNAYPSYFTTDMSLTPPGMFFWVGPNGSYPVTVRYYASQVAIANPETSAAIPWFPSSMYLKTRLAGELMAATDDQRAPLYLGDGTEQNIGRARIILNKVLEMKDDPENIVQQVSLDRRNFRNRKIGDLPNTKVVGF